jgi:hypothetical protein
MNTVLLRTSPAPASAELSDVAANDDALAPAVAVTHPLPPPAIAPQPVAVATSRPDAANSIDDDYYLGGYAGI